MSGSVDRFRPLDPAKVRFGSDGLVAAVVQDAADGRVLMVGWQDAEALAATLATGEVHFRSRSRGTLWRKGETSGNSLALLEAQLDCDADAILLRVRPAGPTCHTGRCSCFDLSAEEAPTADGVQDPPLARSPAPANLAWLDELWATIEERARTRPQGSYTARLLSGGVDAVARKVTEEATEVLMAARDDAAAQAAGLERPEEALAGEIADLLYHVLVLCAERGMPPARVIGVLRERHAR